MVAKIVASDLAADVVTVGDLKFHLHKSNFLHKLKMKADEESPDELM